MIEESSIEQELRWVEAKNKRPFSPSTRKVILEAGRDQRQQMRARIRRSDPRRDGVRREVFERALEAVDFERYEELQDELLRPESIRAHGWAVKYLNLDYWLGKKLEIALDLGLHEASALSILDIGVGAGHFPFVCRLLGHEVVGTDLPELRPSRGWQGRHLFDGLIEVLGVDRRDHAVMRGEPLPDFGGRFDLVTSLMLKFDNPRKAPSWEPADWRFFLDDLAAGVLAPGGRVYLLLNRPFAGEEIMGFMEEAGGTVDRSQCNVLFENLKARERSVDAIPG